jgi:cytochrome c oxidase cbb3-type subunit 3/ubiquinol-cytochrome c reductase cytochrome c subunit
MIRLLLIIMLALVGCDRLPGKPTQADVVVNPDQIKDFNVLYNQNCAGCHGFDGKGNGALSLANPVYLAIANDDVVRNATANGIKGSMMPAFARSAGGPLTDEQVQIIMTGIRTRWSAPVEPAPPPYLAKTKGDVARGGQSFGEFCSRCHRDGSSITNPTYLALITDQSLRTTIIAGRPELEHPDWRNCVSGKPMTDQQVTDIVAWIVSHRGK